MAAKPNPERVYAVISTILQRRYEVKISYSLEYRPSPGPIFSTGMLRKSNENSR